MPTIGEFKHDNLFAGDFDVVTDSVTVGEDLKRGTVIGINGEGVAVAVDSSAQDGSQKPYAVLAEDIEAEGVATVYLTGEFNASALIFGGSDTAATHKEELRKLSIFVK